MSDGDYLTLPTTWEEREDWCRDHGMNHISAIEVAARDEGFIDVWTCGECGALVRDRHQHADFHIGLSTPSNGSRSSS